MTPLSHFCPVLKSIAILESSVLHSTVLHCHLRYDRLAKEEHRSSGRGVPDYGTDPSRSRRPTSPKIVSREWRCASSDNVYTSNDGVLDSKCVDMHRRLTPNQTDSFKN